MPYDSQPPSAPTYSQFQPFEAVTTQLVTWALITVLSLPGYNATVTEEELDALDQTPDAAWRPSDAKARARDLLLRTIDEIERAGLEAQQSKRPV